MELPSCRDEALALDASDRSLISLLIDAETAQVLKQASKGAAVETES